MAKTLQTNEDAPTRLVGREREQGVLGGLLGQASGGRGRLALISGEAGIGKSALVECARDDAVRQGWLVLAGTCYDLTTTPPYGPWRELARRYQTEEQASTDLPAPPAALLGEEGPEPVRSQAILFRQVVAFLSELARRRPLLIVLEDMHWADSASLDLLRVVARHLTAIPALMLVTYRTGDDAGAGLLEPIIRLLVREAKVERLELQPLDRAALDALVSRRYALAGESRARLIEYLERRSQGNPFFALELLYSLEQDRKLQSGESGWRLGDLQHANLPALLQEMIEARLAQLPDDIRQRLLVAAVVGQEVDLGVWCKLLDLSEEEMLATLDLLIERQFVSALPDGRTMRFSHALIHQAAYQSILPPRRRLLHGRIADLLAAMRGVDPDAVAWHFQQAGDERAASWLIRGADRAQRAYAWLAAAERLTAADELHAATDDVRQRGWLKYRIGRLRRHADPVDALGWLETAERFGHAGDDPALVAYARFDRGHILVLSGDYQYGLAMMVDGDGLLAALRPEQIADDIAAWTADALPRDIPAPACSFAGAAGDTRRGTLVQWLAEAGRFEEAWKLGERFVAGLDEMPSLDDQRMSTQGDAWFGLGRVHAQRGRPAEARKALSRALDCYRRIDHQLLVASTPRVELAEVLIPYLTTSVEVRRRVAASAEEIYRLASGAADAALVAGFASLEQMLLDGRWPEAGELQETMAKQPGGIAIWRHRATALLARLERERGHPERAWKLIDEILPGGPNTEPGTTTYVRAIELQLLAADLALDAGDLQLAEAWLNSLDGWLEWSGAVRWRAEALLARARMLAASGDPERARELAAVALNLAGEPAQPLARLAVHRFLGQLETDAGRYPEAGEHLDRALSLAEACEAPHEIALTKLAIAGLRLAQGDRAQSRATLDEARVGFEELGAARGLSEVERLDAQLESAPATVAAPFGLSAREIEVLRLVAGGLTDAQVADELSISYRTVTTHLTSIFTKLAVNSRVSATRLALEHGIV